MKKFLGILVLGLLWCNTSNAGSVGDYPGGFCYTGIGGPTYDGLGGPCYDGLGGPAYDGLGGPCYKTLAGFSGNCPKPCRCKACKK